MSGCIPQGQAGKPTGDDSKSLFVTGIPEGDASARRDSEAFDVFARDIEGDRHREENTVGKTVVVHNTACGLVLLRSDLRKAYIHLL